MEKKNENTMEPDYNEWAESNKNKDSNIDKTILDDKLEKILSINIENINLLEQKLGNKESIIEKIDLLEQKLEDKAVIIEKIDLLEQKLEAKESIIEKIDLLEKKIEKKDTIIENKDSIIENIHKKLEKYENGMIEKIIEPIILDILTVYNTVTKDIKNIEKEDYKDNFEVAYEELRVSYGMMIEELEDVLSNNGVHSYTEEGNQLNLKRQKINKYFETENENADKTIKEVVVKGFEKENRIIQYEKVDIYKYKK